MNETSRDDAVAMVEAFRRRTLSPLEALEPLLDRIARWEPALHALYAFDPEAARAAARASEARWARGEPLSALDGLPCTLKENIATRGTPVPLGTAATTLLPAAADAPPAARLREAGAVLLGKTTMPDWGMLSSGLSSFHPLTRNPWNLAWNPGGSSAGAAAAAAAGYGPLHIGTDIGGSIRLPAAWCGVVGFKPSNGRVPIQPPYPGRVAGPLTRSVRDAALALSVLCRPDRRDTMSLPYQPQAVALGDEVLEAVRGLRLGLLLDAGWGSAPDADTRAAIADAARRFEAAGATVLPMAPFSTREMADGMDRFWRMRSWMDFSALPAERRARVLPYIREWIAAGETLSAAQVFHGFSQMAALREAAVAACADVDFVLSPVSPVPTYPADWASPSNDPQQPFEHIAFTLPYNMSEQPAISVPAGCSADGRPIGLQLVGQRHDDVGVLRLARAWELLRAPQPPWPEPEPAA